MAEEVPSLKKQRRFIIENKSVLSLENQRAMLRIVRMHSPDLIQEKAGKSLINLDLCKPETVTNLYSIVKARRDFLSRPVDTEGWSTDNYNW